MRRLTLCVLALGWGAAASAQDLGHPWTLQECIGWALEHNLTVRQGGISLEQKEIDLNTARNSRLPSVAASASESLSFGRGLTSENTYAQTNTTSTGLSIGGSMTLFDGLATPNQIRLARLNLDAATADLEKARDDIRIAVAQAYVQILYNEEIREVARQQVAIDSLQVVRLEAMAGTGKASSAEVAQQQASLAQSRSTLVQAGNNARMSCLDLAQLLEFPSAEGFSVARPAAVPGDRAIGFPDDIYADAVEVRPAVAAERIRLEGTEKSLLIARSALFPTLSLSGGAGTNYYTPYRGLDEDGGQFWNQVRTNFSPYVGVSLNIPIFNKFATRNAIRSARLNQELQRIQLEKTKQSLYKEIQQAWNGAVAAQAKYQASGTAADSAEEAFRLVQAKYENGKATVTEFNEARNTLMKTRSDLVQATYEYLFQTRLLDFYRGAPLDL